MLKSFVSDVISRAVNFVTLPYRMVKALWQDRDYGHSILKALGIVAVIFTAIYCDFIPDYKRDHPESAAQESLAASAGQPATASPEKTALLVIRVDADGELHVERTPESKNTPPLLISVDPDGKLHVRKTSDKKVAGIK